MMFIRKKKIPHKDLTQDLRDESGVSVYPPTVHRSLIRNGNTVVTEMCGLRYFGTLGGCGWPGFELPALIIKYIL